MTHTCSPSLFLKICLMQFFYLHSTLDVARTIQYLPGVGGWFSQSAGVLILYCVWYWKIDLFLKLHWKCYTGAQRKSVWQPSCPGNWSMTPPGRFPAEACSTGRSPWGRTIESQAWGQLSLLVSHSFVSLAIPLPETSPFPVIAMFYLWFGFSKANHTTVTSH